MRNPDAVRHAVALAYGSGDSAPRVVAKGSRALAEEIVRRANEAGIFVHESPELLSLLMQVDLDREIPETLYLVVAELLAWIYRVERAQTGSAARGELTGESPPVGGKRPPSAG